MSLVSMNWLPRAWSSLNKWMHLSPWTDTIKWKQKKPTPKTPKQRARPWTYPGNPAHFLLFLLDGFAFSLDVASFHIYKTQSKTETPASSENCAKAKLPSHSFLSPLVRSSSSSQKPSLSLTTYAVRARGLGSSSSEEKLEMIEKWEVKSLRVNSSGFTEKKGASCQAKSKKLLSHQPWEANFQKV